MYKKLSLFLIFFWVGFLLNAQGHIQFKNYTIKDGLSQSTVLSISQDKIGALWVGTQDGINRFNGKEFEIYSSAKGDSISNGFINASTVDKNGNIWFGTRDGLTMYNAELVRFKPYTLSSGKQIDITTIEKGKDNLLWLGTSYGEIYTFDLQTKKFSLFDNHSFSSNIVDIRVKDHQIIIVSQYNGVLLINKSTNTSTHVLLSKEEHITINRLIQSPYHDIAIATNKGVYFYSPAKHAFLPTKGILSQLKDVTIMDVLFLSPSRVLVATENHGLFQLQKNKEKKVSITNYTTSLFQKGALPTNQLNQLFRGKHGIVWITSGRGISSYNPNFPGFKGVGITVNPKKGLISENVWGFAESTNNRFLYVATDRGVSRFDRKKQIFQHFTDGDNFGSEHSVLTLQTLSPGRLLVGRIDGLYKLIIDENNPQRYHYQKIPIDPKKSRDFNVIYSIIPYTIKGCFLIGTRAGVMLYNINKNTFHYLSNKNSNNFGPGACRFVFQIDNQFYTSPESGGIYQIKYNKGSLSATSKNIFSPLNKATTNYFSAFVQTNDNTFWFATMGAGIFKYNTSTKTIASINKSNGLPNNVIYGIKNTKKLPNFIWLSTNKGVVAYNISSGKSYTFTTRDGLMSNELNQGAIFLSSTGNLYFGGIQGYNFVKPQSVFYYNKNLAVFFTGIWVENQPVFPKKDGILSKSISFTKKISLPYNKRSLKLRFFANDLTNPERIEYKYKLEGGDNISEIIGSTNFLRLTSLAPGKYDLSIYARITNHSWNNQPAHLMIIIQRPFWLTWWFYILLAILLFLYIFYRVRKRIDMSRRQKVRLQMKVTQRTRELRNKTKQIEKQKQELEYEKEKSERLLNNVLPKSTALQLKKEGKSTARDFNLVSILFTDFVGFSKIAENMEAKELVGILDTHFRAFDAIIDKNNLEKIKTIGDAYMCAGGVPIRNRTNPISTTLAAVQIKHYMLDQNAKQKEKGEPFWRLRIGINTGAVSAGVIGTKRYAYDIWGKAVNRAQRMEKFCPPGCVLVSEDTFRHIEPYFEARKLDPVEMKTGALVNSYEIIRVKPELSINGLGIEPNDAFKKLVDLHHYSKINYIKSEHFIFAKLKKDLDPKLYYHSYKHSMDVTRQVERIAIEEGITDEDLFLLKTAASYHDAGFIEQYDKHEPIGARMVSKILPSFGYTEEHIEKIKELIYATKFPHRPKNLLEKIICDADLDYLGRDDFHHTSDLLRKELRERGKLNSDRAWDQQQVKFFKLHHYFTETAKKTRLQKKEKHLKEIQERIKKDNYKD